MASNRIPRRLPTLAQHDAGVLLKASCKRGHSATLDVPKLIEQHGKAATVLTLRRVVRCSSCAERVDHVWLTPKSAETLTHDQAKRSADGANELIDEVLGKVGA